VSCISAKVQQAYDQLDEIETSETLKAINEEEVLVQLSRKTGKICGQ